MANSEDEEWEIMQNYFRTISERLILAGWLTREIDGSGAIGMGLTEKGVERMNNLFEAIRDLDPHTMRKDHIMGLFYFSVLRDEQLHPPQAPD